MSLSVYRKKRSFGKTPEPKGKKKSSGRDLLFVVQKHDASHLHYDFRLEMEGVLKSWAVPKGPSMNPADKRLAMMVEDHPFEYKDFEGIIPEGNYGAGTVIVWDTGTYEPLVPVSGGRKEAEKNLLQQLKKGMVKFNLHGEKLQGGFVLVHTRGRGENAWLLIKERDKYAKETDITKKTRSVQSGMNLEQVAKNSTTEWVSNKKVTVKKKPAKAVSKKKVQSHQPEVELNNSLKQILASAPKSAMPEGLVPMKAALTDKAFDDKGWLFEIKWDGYRTLAYCSKGKVELRSRKDLSFNKKFYPVAEALEGWNMNAVIDGEIVALNKQGKAEFQLLQQWQKTGEGELAYFVFDIIWLNGHDLSRLGLSERKQILKAVLPENNIIRYTDQIEEKGKAFFAAAVKKGLEGIMGKLEGSNYTPGIRSQQWLKIKTHHRQEAVIAGFTEARKSRKYFGALILGVYKGGELQYVGHTGSGFDDKGLAALHKKLQSLITTTCPFKKRPPANMPPTWVKPKLVCEIEFSEWTTDGIMRQPIFKGLREDKDPKEVKKEESIHIKQKLMDTKQVPRAKKTSTKKTTTKKNASSGSFLNEESKEQEVTINKKELSFTNLNKVYWPKEKYTKRDVLNYYYEVAPYIMPYMKDRPQSLHRFPEGIKGLSFYQKDVSGKVAPWIETYDYLSESDGETKKFLVCKDEATLLYIANLGCIEMNPWHSTIQHPDKPDWCVIDLDPGKIAFEKVIETARVIKEVTDELKIDSYPKTSGSTGLHIYIPLGAAYTYDQSRQLAELLVTLVNRKIPSFTSLERSPAKRRTKIYLDYLQNRSIQTIAAPYSIRPKPAAPVSTPLHWEEVKKGLAIEDFTIENTMGRLKEEGDIFKPVLGKGIRLEKVLDAVSKLLEEE